MWRLASAITSGNLEPNEENGRLGMKTSGYSQRLENMSLAVGLIGLPILLAPSAHAVPDSQESALPVQKSSSSLWDQQYMLGDWGGERDRLADEGVTFDFNKSRQIKFRLYLLGKRVRF
jgi:hypothetical protein